MLQRVSIQNFKSLKDVTLDLQKVNLLIGPNNSGKTNFLKALEFIKSVVSANAPTDISSLTFKRNKENITFTFSGKDLNDCVVKIPLNRNISVLDKNEGYTDPINDSYFGFSDKFYWANELKESLSNTVIFNPNPTTFIKPVNFSADEIRIKGDCSNLIQYLFFVQNNFKSIYRKIEVDLEYTVGDLVSISTPPIKIGNESLLGLKFFDAQENGYAADEVSEGVLYFLALLCIVHQPNPPKLLLLEEPERGIHPRRIGEVMNFIFQLAEEKDIQIVLTTHNEHVLNDFATRPEAVFVFDKNEEATTEVRNLKKDIIDPSHKKSREMGFDGIDFTTNLSDNWIYGLLGGVPENI